MLDKIMAHKQEFVSTHQDLIGKTVNIPVLNDYIGLYNTVFPLKTTTYTGSGNSSSGKVVQILVIDNTQFIVYDQVATEHHASGLTIIALESIYQNGGVLANALTHLYQCFSLLFGKQVRAC